jgi:large subunit ribosomal protein L15
MGGQTPIHQQLPYKRGFINIWKTRFNLLNLEQLGSFEGDVELTPDSLFEMGLLRDKDKPLKILADGDLSKAIRISAHKVSENARRKIEAAGGTVTLIDMPAEPKRPRGQSMAGVRAGQARQEAGANQD